MLMKPCAPLRHGWDGEMKDPVNEVGWDDDVQSKSILSLRMAGGSLGFPSIVYKQYCVGFCTTGPQSAYCFTFRAVSKSVPLKPSSSIT